MTESEFERILIQNAPAIKADSIIIPFKKTVFDSEGNSAKPDLALICNDYKEWYIIEIEMMRHSLYSHVIPQITTLKNATYGVGEAQYIASKNSYLDLDRLIAMMRGDPPKILVIVDKLDSEWEREVKRTGAYILAFEVYRSDYNTHLFRITGELPVMESSVLTYVEVDKLLPRFAVVSSPAALVNIRNGETIKVQVNGRLTIWQRVDTGGACFLSCLGQMPLKKGKRYALKYVSDDHYIMEPVI